MAEKAKLASKEKPKVESNNCNDKKCPFHSGLSLRGRTFVGTVVADKMQGTVNVEWPRVLRVSKYERFEKKRSRVKAHVPKCMIVKLNDKVKISECRPLSKTKKFVVIEKLQEAKQ